jgi:hypothetical protein
MSGKDNINHASTPEEEFSKDSLKVISVTKNPGTDSDAYSNEMAEMARDAVGRLLADNEDEPEKVTTVVFRDSPTRPRPTRLNNDFLEDDFDAFRSRYSRGDTRKENTDSRPRQGRPVRSSSGATAPLPYLRERSSSPRRSEGVHLRNNNRRENGASAYSTGSVVRDTEPSNAVHWVGAIVGVGLLIVLVVLVYQVTVLNGRLAETEAELYAATNNVDNVLDLQLQLAVHEEQLQGKASEIASLRAYLENLGHDPDMPSQAGDGRPGTEDYLPGPSGSGDDFPRFHTVADRETLSDIALIHFGSSSHVYVTQIAAANNLSDPNRLSVGQTLVIPAVDS